MKAMPAQAHRVGSPPDPGSDSDVISILLAMLAIMLVAGVIVLYVAFPHRGEEVPHTPWVGDAMRKGVDLLPTLDNQRAREHQHH